MDQQSQSVWGPRFDLDFLTRSRTPGSIDEFRLGLSTALAP